MIDLSEKIVEILKSGDGLLLAVFLVVAFFLHASKIIAFVENSKKKQINRLQEAMACTSLDDKFKDFLTHEIQREYFLYVTNIAGEKQYRDRLFEIHKNADGNLPFFHFRRASGFIKYENNDVAVKIRTSDKVSYIINSVGFILFLLLGVGAFILSALSKPNTITQVVSFFGLGLTLLVVALLFASQTFPIYSAKRVRDEIEKQERELNIKE